MRSGGAPAVLISGSSGGIGRATVARFLARGYAVIGIDLEPPAAEHRDLRWDRVDVRDPLALRDAVERLSSEVELRHVVSLAGRVLEEEWTLGSQGPADAARTFAASLELNLTGQYNLVNCTTSLLRGGPEDRSITLISSVNALSGFGAPGYSAAKAGLLGLMNAMVPALGDAGVRINVVAPGTTRTPLTENEAKRFRDRRRFKRVASVTPLGRAGEPDDVAAAIESLALLMTHVTGEVVRVDGGHLNVPKG